MKIGSLKPGKIIKIAVGAAVIAGLIVAALIVNGLLTEKTSAVSDCNLTALYIEQYTFSPEFDKNTLQYEMKVMDTIDKLQITAVPEDTTAKVKILGNMNYTEGKNIVTIIVTASDGNKKTYEITVDYEPSSYIDTAFKGNLGENLMNGGIAAVKGDYVFYLNDDGEIYRQKSDGSSRLMIGPAGSSHINVIGNNVYFINDYSVYTVRTDGTQLRELENYKTGNALHARYLMIYNGYIYYSNATSARNTSSLYRIPVDYDETVTSTRVSKSVPYQLIVNEDTVYFINDDDGNRIYTVPVNGGKTSAISDVGASVFCLKEEDETIYFIGKDDSVLYRMKWDGSEEPAPVKEGVTAFTLDGDYVICSTESESFVFNLKSDDVKVNFADRPTDSYSITGSYVYFRMKDDDGVTRVYRFLRNYSAEEITPNHVG